MALSALPAELLSRICRFIALADGQTRGGLPQRFKTLRLTCKTIYQKTLFDAGILYGGMLEHICIKITFKSLGVLFAISNAPFFRDRVQTITIIHQEVELHNNEHYARCQYQRFEDEHEFANSPEAIYILTQCFKNFAQSPWLQKISMPCMEAYPTVFAALEFARYPRSVASVWTDPENYRQSWYDRFLNPLSKSPHLISQIDYRVMYYHKAMSPDERAYDVKYNEWGRHYSNFKSVTPVLSTIAAKLTGVKTITLRGCSDAPRLRLCHGCEDIGVNLFAKHTYPHLAKVTLAGIYVSGGRLRSFIKRHCSTLQRISFHWISLTDGSWRSIAQGLRKCRNLNYLDMGFQRGIDLPFGSLLQKNAAPPLADSIQEVYAAAQAVEIGHGKNDLRGRKEVANWLDIFVRYFMTRPHVWRRSGRVLANRPAYHEVRIFFGPEMMSAANRSYLKKPTCSAKERYLKGIGED